MRAKDEIIKKMRDDFVYYIESALAIKAQNSGELIDIRLNSTQIRFLEALIERNFKDYNIRRNNGTTKS